MRAVGIVLLALTLLAPTALALGSPTIGHGLAQGQGMDIGPDVPSVHLPAPPDVPPAPTSASEAGAPNSNGYHIEFQCPTAAQVTVPVNANSNKCPNRVVDADDTLGNPSLAVDPIVPGRYSFASLHGQPARGKAPTPLAREGQTHTTFSTVAVGQQWQDQPYRPPQDAFPDGQNILGLDVAAVIDPQRTLHIAALYAWTPRGTSDVNYTIVLWKFDQELREANGQGLTQADYELVSATFSNRLPGSVIDDLWLVSDEATGTIDLLWHEHTGPNSTLSVPGVGNVTSWVAGAVTSADAFTPWAKMPESLLLAPCGVATNPVLVDGRIVFGCEAPAKGEPILGLAGGEIAMRAIEPTAGTVATDSKAPLSFGTPKLAATKSGDLVLVTSRVVYENGTPPPNTSIQTNDRTIVRAEMAIQPAGGDWGSPREFGDKIHNASRMVRAARFTAALWSDATSTLHLVYIEDTLSTDRNVSRWTKALVALDRTGTVVEDLDLKLQLRAEAGRVPGSQSDAYGDTRDSLVRVAGKEYIAFNDYAVVVFAQVVEKDDRVQPIVQQSLPPVPEPVPVVQTTAVATATGIGLGATAAVGAGALVARRMASVAGQGRGKK